MHKVVITIISKRQLANAAILMESADEHLKDWDKIVYVLDLSKTEQYKNSNIAYNSAEKLIGEEFKDIAFYFLENELSEYVKIFAIHNLLVDYDCVLLSDCEGIFYFKPDLFENALSESNTVVKMVPHHFDEYETVPDKFLLSQEETISKSELFGISKGPVTLKFIDWCIIKFKYLMYNRYTTIIDDNTLIKANIQSSFILNWQQYTDYFKINEVKASTEFYRSLSESDQNANIQDNPAFISFINFTKRVHKKTGNKKELISNPKIKNYLEQVYNYNKSHKIEYIYLYNRFSDGTVINKFLRPYYFNNYRLRDKCEKNPFEHRKYFTDTTVITGDDFPVPLSAIADCIWCNRPDLQSAFQKYNDQDRMAYINWFLKFAAEEYDLSNQYFSVISELYKNHLIVCIKNEVDLSKNNYISRIINKIKRIISPKSVVNTQIVKYDTYPSGINLSGFIRGNFGLGEATRILARTLDSKDVPFSIVNYTLLGNHTYTNHEWDSKITNEFDYNTNLMLIDANGIPEFLRGVSRSVFKNRYNIGFIYWELPEFPEILSKTFSVFDEIWTASEYSAEAFRKVTSLPVYCLPCCVTAECNDKFDRDSFGLPKDAFLFLMMYDVQSLQERKNPIAAINAFLQAFKDRTDVMLVIKISIPRDRLVEDELTDVFNLHENIILIQGTFDKIKVNSFINCCDAFISLHRCEGFGLGPAEAMYLGKPTILTNWSGNKEYMTNDNCCPVDYKIVVIDKDYGPYKKGNHWADPSVEHAAMYMKRLVEDKDYYKKIADNGQRTIREKFSPQAVCEIALARLRKLKLM